MANSIHDGTSRDAATRDTAIAVSGGEQYHNPKKITCAHWEIQPPLRRYVNCNNFVDLSGRKVGRLTVLGLHAKLPGAWVVRCSCGDFETRKAKAISNPENFGDRCSKCRQLAFEYKRFHFEKTGEQIDPRTL